MIRYSIITITYNAERVIERTLKSVENQDYKEIEHLIIDGASSDRTLTLVDEYVARNEKSSNKHEVKIVSEKDKGIYDAMNKGLHLAAGDYIIFLNAGDCLHDTWQLKECAKRVGEDCGNSLPAVIYGDTDLVDEDGVYIGRRRLTPPEKLTWKSFKYGMLVCHQSFYALRSLAVNFDYDLQYRHSADVDWCIRIMKEAQRRDMTLYNSHLTLTDYQKEGNTTVNHRASLFERFDVMRKHYGLITTIVMHCWFVVRALFK